DLPAIPFSDREGHRHRPAGGDVLLQPAAARREGAGSLLARPQGRHAARLFLRPCALRHGREAAQGREDHVQGDGERRDGARAARPRRAGDRATQGVEYAAAAMSRHLKIAAAQLGPLHRADSRSSAVKRLVALLKEAHGMGAKFVVFPELAFTTFFPRWWMEDQAEVDRKYFESTVPSPE